MKSTILIKLNSFKSKGFTLVELMVAISIIGILSLIALPNYQGYVNESKAATLLYRIHSIGLAYQDVIATSPDALAKPNQLSSSSFGQAPSYLPGLANQFSEEFGIQFSAQLVNHSGYFNFTGHEAFPVLFLKANSQNHTNPVFIAGAFLTVGYASFGMVNILLGDTYMNGFYTFFLAIFMLLHAKSIKIPST